MKLQPYLKRIDYRGGVRPDHSVLAALQQAHICTVPFENLDVQFGRPVTLSAEDAYDKIVVNNRGGWCYEQNGLFAWALTEIGFEVTRAAAAVMRQDRGDVSLGNHLCLLVRVPGSTARFLVDVGFGGSMIRPIPLVESEHSQPPFHLGLKKVADDYWRFWEDLGEGKFSFDFVAEPADETALRDKCESLQSSPSSSFVLNLVAQLRSQEQHKVLRGRVLRIASATGITTQTLMTGDEVVVTLRSHFGLDLPEVADLWPKIAARHEEIHRTNCNVRGG